MQRPSHVFLGSILGIVTIFTLILTVQAAPDLRQKPDVVLQPEATLELTPEAYELLPEDVLLEKALAVAQSRGLSERVTLDDLADTRRLYSTYIHLTEFLPGYANPERYDVSKFSRPIFVTWIVGKGLRMVIGGHPYPPCLDHTRKITPGIVIALFADTGQLISSGKFGSVEYIPKAKDDPTIQPGSCGE